MWCSILLGLLGFSLFGFIIVEAPYLLWLGFVAFRAYVFRRKVDILSQTRIKGLCLLRDLDPFLFHMNNTRYVRELDFAKVDFVIRTGLAHCIIQYKGTWVVGGTTIRYRRFIRPFQLFTVTSRIIYWDESNIYLENRFLTQPDDFVNAIAFSRIRVTNCNANTIINELLKAGPQQDIEASLKKPKPEVTPELAKWIESNDLCSTRLRK